MNETQCRRIVRERSQGICELCPKLAVQQHHRRNRSQGGQWIPSNILHLCLECHHHITVHPAAAVRNGWTIQGTQAISSLTDCVRRGERVVLSDCGDVLPVSRYQEGA